tara:strand:+ start:561 stop:794 length:234 start_codon:yes stop_codon:yes gene_type:complete
MSKISKDNVLMTEEAAEIVGVKPKSVYTFIKKHNVKHGMVKMRGKQRLVVERQSLEETVSRLGYDGSFDVDDIEWNN